MQDSVSVRKVHPLKEKEREMSIAPSLQVKPITLLQTFCAFSDATFEYFIFRFTIYPYYSKYLLYIYIYKEGLSKGN